MDSGVSKQACEVVGRDGRMHDQELGHAHQQRDQRQIPRRVVAQLGVECACRRDRAVDGDADRPSIGGSRDLTGAKRAACARLIVDDEGFTERRLEMRRHDPRHDVGRRPARERHDKPDRAGRPCRLRPRQDRGQQAEPEPRETGTARLGLPAFVSAG